MGWVVRPSSLIKRGAGVQVLKVRFVELLNESRECFERANICNQSKSLQYICNNKLDTFV